MQSTRHFSRVMLLGMALLALTLSTGSRAMAQAGSAVFEAVSEEEGTSPGTVLAKTNELVQCVSVDGDTQIEVLFDTASGDYRAISMIASDPTVSQENAEIARFEADDGLLGTEEGRVVGRVDLRNPKTGRKGERIGGTLLGALKTITLSLDISLFDLNAGVLDDTVLARGSQFSGQALYLKRNGEQHNQDLDCTSRRW